MFKNIGRKIIVLAKALLFFQLAIIIIAILIGTAVATGEDPGIAVAVFLGGTLAGAVLFGITYLSLLPTLLSAEIAQDVKQIKKALAGESSVPALPKNPPDSTRKRSTCTSCGAELPRGVMFCTQCGKPVLSSDGGSLSSNGNPRFPPNRTTERETARDTGYGKPGFQTPNDFEL